MQFETLWKQQFDVPLFTVCVVICVQKCSIDICGTKVSGSAKGLICSYTCYGMIYLFTAIGLTAGGSSTVHIAQNNN